MIELTKEEAKILINMINVCVQVKGLEAAESAVILVKKIQKVFEQENEIISSVDGV